jgi:sugar (pentulose or hexulose) kinase
VRAILERVSATHGRLVEGVRAGRRVNAVVATGGGARSPLWLQITADMLGLPVVTPTCLERACLGAAAFAAVAAGLHPTLEVALKAMVRRGRTFEPAANGIRGVT